MTMDGSGTHAAGSCRAARRCVRTAVALCLPLAPGLVAAQAPEPDEPAELDVIKEIVVTAQRREERMLEVPIAITALSGEALSDRGITNLEGIASTVPSLSLSSYPNSSDTLSLNMRGQGTADAGQITKDGGVGLYVDGFYIARPQAALFDLGQPERVEVLRGPQGTLYGRNTTGGAINIITQKPTGVLGGTASVTIGSRDYVRAVGHVDLPEVGSLALKGSFVYVDQDGWVKNGSENRFGMYGQQAGRIAARWEPRDTFRVDYAVDLGRVTSTPNYYVNPALEGAIPGYVADRDHTYEPLRLPESEADFFGHQLTLTWQVLDSLTLKSLTGYRDFEADQYVNYGFAQSSPMFPIEVFQDHDYRMEQISQELQAIGALGARLDYTGGLYLFRERGDHLMIQDVDMTLLSATVRSERLVDVDSKSYAAYLQVTWTPPVLEDRLKWTVGGRYTRDEREAVRNRTVNGAPIELAVTNEQKFSDFSPSTNLTFQWTHDLMTYIKASEGYKAGGSSEGTPDFTLTYDAEKVTSYEAGLKSRLFGRRLALEVAAFYNEFDDIQIDFVSDPADMSVVTTINAGAATVKGLEVDLVLQPIPGLTLRGSYAYLDTEIDTVKAPAATVFDPALNPASPFQVGDEVGDHFVLPFAPESAWSVSVDWLFLRRGGNDFSFHAAYSHRDPVYTVAAAGPAVVGREYFRSDRQRNLDAKLSWVRTTAQGWDMRVSLFAENLTDERYRGWVIGVGSPITGFESATAPWSEPRTFGLEAKIDF